ncbi:hypothetical protein [Pandoraea sp. ISTKB]|uniref:hypothetical protein n=1 Tax=Pandoraea sp. ISTKB TaxID=1586708 RepID=UPI000846739C|nr:hypothetical protein [Pandoraea sp. ISTKB]ODP35029.1 hypothetical protein A9762_11735 [Pandoraea sp. ISTKB]
MTISEVQGAADAQVKGSFSDVAELGNIRGSTHVFNDRLDWMGRKVCSVTKVVSTVITAIAIEPGSGASADEIRIVAKELLCQAKDLADAAAVLIPVDTSDPQFPAYMSALREDAAESISLQWRLAHAFGRRPLTPGQISAIYAEVPQGALSRLHSDRPSADVDADLTVVMVERIALFSVAAEVHAAVTAFDYFHPRPADIVATGVRTIRATADRAFRELVQTQVLSAMKPESELAIRQTLIEQVGTLYAQSYRACARNDVLALEAMNGDERLVMLETAKGSGLPMSHVDEAFERLMGHMLSLICEGIPELRASQAECAPPTDTLTSPADDTEIEAQLR